MAGPHDDLRMPDRKQNERPGHAEIRAASRLHPNSGAWAFFMREIIRLPMELTPAVVQIIRIEAWKLAPDPLDAIRMEALRAHQRAWPRTDSPLPVESRVALRNGKNTSA